MKILVLNSGSSSQKISLFEIDGRTTSEAAAALWKGEIEFAGNAAALAIEDSNGTTRQSRIKFTSRAQAVKRLLRTLWAGDSPVLSSASAIDAVGHRVVHGGPKYREPVIVNHRVKTAIASVSAFAPLHNRDELAGIDVIQSLLGRVPQIAVFDTGFHRHMPPSATVYPGPYEWFSNGIFRYGFHGINHHYCAGRAAQMLGKNLKSLKIVTCHLGNGCSLAAIRDGHSIDTTMGFTPLEGLMMGTRSGSVDPGILTYLMQQRGMKGKQLDRLLNRESGLLGVSGLSGDMRKILAARKSGHKRAALAFDIYIHRLCAGIAAMTAPLGGIDALVFTAGIGENATEVRAAACEPLEFLGIRLDSKLNAKCTPDQDISRSDSPGRVLVIRAQEDWAIARDCWALMSAKRQPGSKRKAPVQRRLSVH